MDWDDELCINVRIPHGEDLDDLDTDVFCYPVPGPLIEVTIQTLQAVLAQWTDDAGNEPEDERWGPILAAAGYVLGELLHVQATRDSRQGARRLVNLIAKSWFPSSQRQHLEALRQDPETGYIVEALLALQPEAERRHKERLRQRSAEENWRRSAQRTQQPAAPEQQPAAPEQQPATERDPGWEF
jgi:hypothetical protein